MRNKTHYRKKSNHLYYLISPIIFLAAVVGILAVAPPNPNLPTLSGIPILSKLVVHPTFDATSEMTAKTSFQAISRGMTVEEKRELLGSMFAVCMGDILQSAMIGVDIEDATMFQAAHGMTAEQLLAKAEEIQRKREEERKKEEAKWAAEAKQRAEERRQWEAEMVADTRRSEEANRQFRNSMAELKQQQEQAFQEEMEILRLEQEILELKQIEREMDNR